MFKKILVFAFTVTCFAQNMAFADTDVAQAIASAANKLKQMNVCNLGGVDISEIQSEMEGFDEEEFAGLQEMARELKNKPLTKHIDKYKYTQNHYITFEPEDCEWETLIIQVNRAQGTSKGLIYIGEDVKVRDL